MNMRNLIENSKSIDDDLTAVLSFKLSPKDKEKFVTYSVKNNVSMGLLMRNIIREILKEIEDDV